MLSRRGRWLGLLLCKGLGGGRGRGEKRGEMKKEMRGE